MATRRQQVPANEGSPPSTTPGWTPTPDQTGEEDQSSNLAAYMALQQDRAFAALKRMPLDKRLKTLELLRRKGLGSGAPVSEFGLEVSDINRYRELLVYADSTAGMTVKKALDNITNAADVAVSSAARRKTNIKDVDAVFDNVVTEMLGRRPTQEEASRFRAAYSGMESGGNAPNLQVAAQAQVEQKMGPENEAAQFAQYANVFEQMMRGA